MKCTNVFFAILASSAGAQTPAETVQAQFQEADYVFLASIEGVSDYTLDSLIEYESVADWKARFSKPLDLRDIDPELAFQEGEYWLLFVRLTEDPDAFTPWADVSASYGAIRADDPALLTYLEELGEPLEVFDKGGLPAEVDGYRIDENEAYVPWLGKLWAGGLPWHHHPDLGWVFLSGLEDDAAWFWSNDQSNWIYTAANGYPLVYDPAKSWLYLPPQRQHWAWSYTQEAWIKW
ncbi:MAG: hypothetical protein E1N59_2437 [Puniceicoccaceae bacterium 5H]|nr:MAG: hypothetical protein E1N59_2437 [Puniceicoccaceae bacterium 5H]